MHEIVTDLVRGRFFGHDSEWLAVLVLGGDAIALVREAMKRGESLANPSVCLLKMQDYLGGKRDVAFG
jgi:hypothetical protein